MNNRKRAALRQAIEHLNKACCIVSSITDQERDALDNMPENLQGGTRYEQIEKAIDHLENASENIDDAIEDIESACIT